MLKEGAMLGGKHLFLAGEDCALFCATEVVKVLGS